MKVLIDLSGPFKSFLNDLSVECGVDTIGIDYRDAQTCEELMGVYKSIVSTVFLLDLEQMASIENYVASRLVNESVCGDYADAYNLIQFTQQRVHAITIGLHNFAVYEKNIQMEFHWVSEANSLLATLTYN